MHDAGCMPPIGEGQWEVRFTCHNPYCLALMGPSPIRRTTWESAAGLAAWIVKRTDSPHAYTAVIRKAAR